MASEYSSSGMDRGCGRSGGGILLLVAEWYVKHEGHKLGTPDTQALKVTIAAGDSSFNRV